MVKEGERKLTARDYLMQVRGFDSSAPLYYDKQMLKEWLRKEFKAKS